MAQQEVAEVKCEAPSLKPRRAFDVDVSFAYWPISLHVVNTSLIT